MILRINDGSKWSFEHGSWKDGNDEKIEPVDDPRENGEEEGIQGYRFAFLKEGVYKNLKIKFQICHDFAHSDVGFIFRAISKQNFYLLHFPCCGQAYRAKNFWASLSEMDESGFIRIKKLSMVNRVPSDTNLWHDVEVSIKEGKLHARIDTLGNFEVSDLDSRPGRVGVLIFNRASIRDVEIEGEQELASQWNEDIKHPTNWFYPYDDDTYGKWQKPQSLLRALNGDIILNFSVMDAAFKAKSTVLILRSKNNGRIWSKPEIMKHPYGDTWGMKGRLHVFPDGKIRFVSTNENRYFIQEVSEDVTTFSEPKEIGIKPQPPGIKSLHMGPQAFVNLANGTTVMFLYGGHESSLSASSIHTWSSHHCQAYTCYSTDNGNTWSPLINLDGVTDGEGKPVEGSLDLTEVCGTETKDGNIMALIRPIYSPWMWETWSRDSGVTWGPCVRGAFPGYATPNMMRTSSGAILAAHRLPGLTIHTSLDRGITWDNGTMIDSAIWVMGSMLEIKPDCILYVYYDSFESKMRAQFIKVTSAGLMPVRRDNITS